LSQGRGQEEREKEEEKKEWQQGFKFALAHARDSIRKRGDVKIREILRRRKP